MGNLQLQTATVTHGPVGFVVCIFLDGFPIPIAPRSEVVTMLILFPSRFQNAVVLKCSKIVLFAVEFSVCPIYGALFLIASSVGFNIAICIDNPVMGLSK